MRTDAVLGGRLRDRIRRASLAAFVGRERELALIDSALAEDGPVVTFVHGMGGIGKSALLDAAAPRLAASGARVVRIDGRNVEPTPRGFLDALAAELAGESFGDVEDAARTIDRAAEPIVVIIDDLDRLRLLDSWLRQTLLPVLPDRTRWVIAGRFAPHSAWISSPGWSEAVRSIRLDPLGDAESRVLLARRGAAEPAMQSLLELARGNPLALEIAARGIDPHSVARSFGATAVLELLARRWIDDIHDVRLRAAVEAACIVRCATRPLLEAITGQACDDAMMTALAELPFVEPTEDGLLVDEVVRHAVRTRLAALDPQRFASLRAAAWRSLESMLSGSPAGKNAWRLTADVLFLVEHAEIREAFFPSATMSSSVEAALGSDEAAVLAIAARHEPAPVQAIVASWWRLARDAFRVVRDASGGVKGFAIVADVDAMSDDVLACDPLARAWRDHHLAGPGRDRGALFIRAALSAEAGEGASETRAALWIDVKRTYIERPDRWAVYTRTRSPERTLPAVERLGFRLLELPAEGNEHTLQLPFGADGIWTWLRRLVGSTTSTASPRGWSLDSSARALRIDGVEVALSPLEYGVLGHLLAANGKVVTRDDLLEAVWKQRFVGSNVVDAVIRLLRKKLGAYSELLETVKGHGYRIARDR